MSLNSLRNTLEEPPKLDCIPIDSQWLAGEGAGSWFHINAINNRFSITRYSPKGKIECTGIFEITNNSVFDLNLPFKFCHLSHCKIVNIQQNDNLITMKRTNDS